MKFFPISLFCFLLWGCATPRTTETQNASPIQDGAVLQRVGTGYAFTEGPAVDAAGNVFFTDQPNDQILQWSPDGSLTVYMEGTGRSNGLYFDHAGNLLACADENNELWRISPNKEVSVLVHDFEGKRLNGPNDLWIDPAGGIYFTDPFYKRKYWTHTEMEQSAQNVYYLSPDQSQLRVAAEGLVQPNGIVGTADGKQLFVADIGDQKTYRYQIGANGSLTNRTLFAEMGSDGMTLDTAGNLYLTGDGVTIFNAQGEQIGHIPVAEKWTANVCFGGKDRKTLFITAMGSVYTLAMQVKGG